MLTNVVTIPFSLNLVINRICLLRHIVYSENCIIHVAWLFYTSECGNLLIQSIAFTITLNLVSFIFTIFQRPNINLICFGIYQVRLLEKLTIAHNFPSRCRQPWGISNESFIFVFNKWRFGDFQLDRGQRSLFFAWRHSQF